MTATICVPLAMVGQLGALGVSKQGEAAGAEKWH
jgi:hypothetical protein